MRLEVDTASAVPPYEQIRQQVTALVLVAALAAGSRPPPSASWPTTCPALRGRHRRRGTGPVGAVVVRCRDPKNEQYLPVVPAGSSNLGPVRLELRNQDPWP